MSPRFLLALALFSTVAQAQEARRIGHGDLPVYRSRQALGKWARLVPRDFDFARESLVLVGTRTREPTCCLVAERLEGRFAVTLPQLEIREPGPCDSPLGDERARCELERAMGHPSSVAPDDRPFLVRVPRRARVLWVTVPPPVSLPAPPPNPRM